MPRSTRLKLLVVALAVGFVACNNNTPTTPSTSSPATTTDTFTGDLTVNGAKTFTFTTQAAGTVTATLTTVSPDSTVAIGVALGTWNGTACQLVVANDNAVQGAVVIAQGSSNGTLCARVFDVGNLTATESFTLSVLHP